MNDGRSVLGTVIQIKNISSSHLIENLLCLDYLESRSNTFHRGGGSQS